MKAISLFCGCGGMDFGTHRAGANIVFANDIDIDSGLTFQKYFSDSHFVPGDISEIDSFPEADLVIGGYPCQSFSMGGNRNPENDSRTYLYKEFARCVQQVNPKFFVAENVAGLQKLKKGRFLQDQIDLFTDLGKYGYHLTYARLDAKNFGVPQSRKRMFIVGVRKDLGLRYQFSRPTHGNPNKKGERHLFPYTSHGEAIKNLPLWPSGEFYERPHDPDGHWSWYFMSRNRKAKWFGPAFTVVANWRHITVHPASPVMKLTWSNLSDGWKQRWDFSDEYEHTQIDPSLPKLDEPRRLSWRECAAIQTFPEGFDPIGSTESKFQQIGNAVPPLLAQNVIEPIIDGSGLIDISKLSLEDQNCQISIELGI